MLNREIGRTIIHVPDRPSRTAFGNGAHAIKGILLGPMYWAFAVFLRGPGLGFRVRCFSFGVRAFLRRRGKLSLGGVFHLLFMPMESTRYFEFDFVWKALSGRTVERYLDVSSPRLMPISLLDSRPDAVADLINPNPSDLEETAKFVDLIGAESRCSLHGCLIADAPFGPETFDIVTSISVLEHIPEDLAAVQRIWELLKPGGAFILTVPCMAKASEQYIDRNEWGVLDKNCDGYVFWQRFYDRELLEQRIFSVTGQPQLAVVFGEKIAGAHFRNAGLKRSDSRYPYWREPYMMAAEYRYFNHPDELPGEGVIGLLFVKKA